jgi:hypothetical protein
MESSGFTLDRLVVVDGKSFKAVAASTLTFSPDGSHFAFLDGSPTPSVVLDGVQRIPAPFAHETGDVPAPFVFSQDGKHIAFASGTPQGRALAIDDGMLVTDAYAHFDITFTPDGRHLVSMGQRSEAPRGRVYVDGEPVVAFDQAAAAQQSAEVWWSMGADGVLTFLAQDGGALKRYRVTPGNSSVDARSRR